jgi:hypothetical protein
MGACSGWWTGTGAESGAQRKKSDVNVYGLRSAVTLYPGSAGTDELIARFLWVKSNFALNQLQYGFYKGDGPLSGCPRQTSGWRLYLLTISSAGLAYCITSSSGNAWPTFATEDSPITLRMRLDPTRVCDGDTHYQNWFWYVDGNERYCGRADHRSWDWRFAAAGYLDDDLRIDVEFDNMEKLAWSSII